MGGNTCELEVMSTLIYKEHSDSLGSTIMAQTGISLNLPEFSSKENLNGR
jgi:hypothetical protein